VLPRDEAFAIPDIIRTATNLVPPEVKDVRIIDIVGPDQQADGGTHVASTRQVGGIQVVKIENKAWVSAGSASRSPTTPPADPS
jgi:misacylated tRNA(Ala) deacylase